MTPETVKAISEALKPLADKLGQSAAFVYQAYTLHAYALGVALTISGLAMVGAAFMGYLTWRKWDDLEVGQVMCPVVIIVGLVLGVPMLSTGIMHLIAPQYYAIQDILCTVKDCTR
jgi:hypothetical protein